MALSANLERLSYKGDDGCVATGLHREIISVTSNTTLTPAQSGALVLMGVASGATLTLPAAAEGMQFDVGFSVSRTSNSYKIICASGDFLLGAYMAGDSTIATSGDVFTGNGSTHLALTFDGDTKGGLVGGRLRFTAISGTQWYVEGMVVGTGTMETAFATS
jgi:hypothetical protein